MNQKKDDISENEEMKQNWEQMENDMINLMSSVEEKQTLIQKLSMELHSSVQQKENAENDRDRLMEKLKLKQQDCENYLGQMEAWRAQVYIFVIIVVIVIVVIVISMKQL